MHQRTIIRRAVTDAILAAKTLADEQVFPFQKLLRGMRHLPAIAVYTPDESSKLNDTAPRELDRVATLAIEALVEARDDVDILMDDISKEIEAAMDLDPYFGGACTQSSLTSTTLVSDPDSDRQLGQVVLTYDFLYRTDAFVQPAAPDDFERANATYDLEGEQAPADQTSDLITVQTP